MREKKVVEISNFANFNKTSKDVLTQTFYNYQPARTLKNCHGIGVAMFPKSETNKEERELELNTLGLTSIDGLAYFKQYQSKNKFTTHRLLVYGSDKKLYVNQMVDDTWDLFWLYNLTFDTAPIVLAYKKGDEDCAILACDNQMVIWETGYSPYFFENVPIITSMCMNQNVLFCTIFDPAFKIWYATDLNVESIGNISNTSGYISLEDDLGYARKIVTFDEDVFVFRDYGISKITFLRGEASVSQIYYSNTKIFANTVSICGNNILFMTKDGLYSFNGISVKKTSVELLSELDIDNSGAIAYSLGEKYYLALKIDFNDQKEILCETNCVNNALMIFNTRDFSYEIIRGVDIKSMLPVKTDVFEKMLFIFNSGPIDKIGQLENVSKIMDENLPKFYSSERLIDSINTKLLTKLMINSDANIKISLICDGKETVFTTYTKGVNEFMFKLCCKDVKVEISSSEESANVDKFVLEYYEY